jgi:hypothetical protein
MHFRASELENLFKAQQKKLARPYITKPMALLTPQSFNFIINTVNFSLFSPLSTFAELKATISGPSEVFVKSGSEITLFCKLQQGPHDLGTIYWYKGECNLLSVV